MQKPYKAIIIGVSLSGKTTLIKYLRNTTDLPISEIDEELNRCNGGEYPKDMHYKNTVLAPKITREILDTTHLLFFTNTDYFTAEHLQEAHAKSFSILQLSISKEEMQKRNTKRVASDGYDDLSRYFEGMLDYQEIIRKKGLVDKVIAGNKPIAEISQELLNFLGERV